MRLSLLMFANTHGRKDCSLQYLKWHCENLERGVFKKYWPDPELYIFINHKIPSQRKKNPIQHKVKQKWDLSFAVVGKLEEMWNVIYPK